ncbi:MAG: agmatinase [Bacillota bacterium]
MTGLVRQSSSFLNCDKAGAAALFGVPFDSTVSFRPGTRLAPFKVRELSRSLETYSPYFGRELTQGLCEDVGDLVLPGGNLGESLERIRNEARRLHAGHRPVLAIGGEHLVSLPLIQAALEYYPDLAVIHIDAHADLRDEYDGEKLSHATVMRRVAEHVNPGRIYQLCIRSGAEEEFSLRETNLYTFSLDAFSKVYSLVKGHPVYLTFDIDAIDPGYAPGTGTPEPGGITPVQVFSFIQALLGLNIVGFDLVEICPPFDHSDITSVLGAKILREIILASVQTKKG